MDLSTLRYAKSHEWAKRDGDVTASSHWRELRPFTIDLRAG